MHRAILKSDKGLGSHAFSFLDKLGTRAMLLSATIAAGFVLGDVTAYAQDAGTTLIVAGPRTPESLDQEYPPTEAAHEARRNIYERLLRYAQKEEDGIRYEDFSKIEGALAESYELA